MNENDKTQTSPAPGVAPAFETTAAPDAPSRDGTLSQTPGQADAILSGFAANASPAIPGYDLMPEIARGGMGVVYRARDLAFDREVAVKVMLPGMSAAAFVREARITGRLPHPGIPPVHALGELPDGRPFLAMKLIRGDTLDKVLKARADLSADRGRLIAAFEQMCQAVGFAHAQGIIHRDLKPSNVMVGAFGEVQVMDWGLAKEVTGNEQTSNDTENTEASLAASQRRASSDTDAATMAGQVKGTPAYMAPEQARGEPVDARADVFALGGILAAILTGKPPFAGNSVMDTIIRAAQADLGDTLARLDASGADADLLALAKRCLAARADDRPSNGVQLAEEVAAYRAEVEERLRRAERERAASEAKAEEQRKRRRVQWALAASVLLLAFAGGFGAVVASLWRNAETQKDIADNAKGVAEQAQAAEESARQKLAVFEYGRTLQVAHQEWREDNITATRTLLDGTRTDLRGWEWHYLNRISDGSLITLKGHSHTVASASFSRDDTRVVTASWDQTARVWDAKTGSQLVTLSGHTGPVNSASFSRDGTRIVTTSSDNTVRVWDANTGKELFKLKGHTGPTCASFSRDGTRIVTGSIEKTAKVWDAKTGDELNTLTGHHAWVHSVMFSADGTRIVTGSFDQTVRVWNAKSGIVLLTIKAIDSGVNTVSLSPGDTHLITGGSSGTARVWNANTGAEVLSLRGHTSVVSSASFSTDGTRIVTASRDRTVKVWESDTGRELLTLRGHTSAVSSASFSTDGTRIVSGSSDRSAHVWDARVGAETHFLDKQVNEIYSLRAITISKDGKQIVAVNHDGTKFVWDGISGGQLLRQKGFIGKIDIASFKADGTQLVTASDNRTAMVWDGKTGAELLTLRGHEHRVRAASFSPDGMQIVTGSDDGTAKVWDAKTGVELLTFRTQSNVNAASFSPDGTRVVTASDDKAAKVWGAKTGAEVLTLKGHTNVVTAVAFSHDGTRIVTGSGDWTAKVWDAITGLELLTLKGHTQGVEGVSWNPDGTRILTWSNDATAKIWDAGTGAELLSLKRRRGFVQVTMLWSPDGSRILAYDDNLSVPVQIWDSRPFRDSRPPDPVREVAPMPRAK